jgi:hypothetical protein
VSHAKQFPYWWRNRRDFILGNARRRFAPSTLCDQEQPNRATRHTCDRKQGHAGMHSDRRRLGPLRVRRRLANGNHP